MDQWRVQGHVKGTKKKIWIGRFASETEAARAYDAHAIVNGIATRNFPDDDEDAVVADVERARALKKKKRAESKTSRFRGVSWNIRRKKWRVQIRVSGKSYTIGCYADEVEAARAYDAFLNARNLVKKIRNFPRSKLASQGKTKI